MRVCFLRGKAGAMPISFQKRESVQCRLAAGKNTAFAIVHLQARQYSQKQKSTGKTEN
jgi:hypothetical protein